MNEAKPDVQRRRAQILAVARDVFAEKGLHEATMSDVVAASGMSKGGLYWHFRTKDDITAGILDGFFDQALAGLRASVDSEAAAGERLREFARGAAADMRAMGNTRDLTLELFALAARRPDVRALVADYYRRYREVLAELIRQGQDRGEFTAVDASATAMTFIAQFEGSGLVWSIDPDGVALETQLEHAVELLLTSLQATTDDDRQQP